MLHHEQVHTQKMKCYGFSADKCEYRVCVCTQFVTLCNAQNVNEWMNECCVDLIESSQMAIYIYMRGMCTAEKCISPEEKGITPNEWLFLLFSLCCLFLHYFIFYYYFILFPFLFLHLNIPVLSVWMLARNCCATINGTNIFQLHCHCIVCTARTISVFDRMARWLLPFSFSSSLF